VKRLLIVLVVVLIGLVTWASESSAGPQTVEVRTGDILETLFWEEIQPGGPTSQLADQLYLMTLQSITGRLPIRRNHVVHYIRPLELPPVQSRSVWPEQLTPTVWLPELIDHNPSDHRLPIIGITLVTW